MKGRRGTRQTFFVVQLPLVVRDETVSSQMLLAAAAALRWRLILVLTLWHGLQAQDISSFGQDITPRYCRQQTEATQHCQDSNLKLCKTILCWVSIDKMNVVQFLLAHDGWRYQKGLHISSRILYPHFCTAEGDVRVPGLGLGSEPEENVEWTLLQTCMNSTATAPCGGT